MPYRTSYYKGVGFCVTNAQYEELKKLIKVQVYINSRFIKKGSLTVGEFLIPGKSKNEILISTYICHPSLANDNLSGVIFNSISGKVYFRSTKQNWSYRIIFVPETIGAIAYCAKMKNFKKINFGFVITTVGGKGPLDIKEVGIKSFFE